MDVLILYALFSTTPLPGFKSYFRTCVRLNLYNITEDGRLSGAGLVLDNDSMPRGVEGAEPPHGAAGWCLEAWRSRREMTA